MAQTHNNLLATTGTTTVNGYSGTVTTTEGWNGALLTTNGTVGMGCINPSERLSVSGTDITTITNGSGLTLQGNSTINYSHLNLIPNNMRPTQAKVAVFTITRDSDTNEINSTTFVKELWVEQKNGTSIDLLVAKKLDKDFDPETTIIKVLSTVQF
jgi:hypothetical protein